MQAGFKVKNYQFNEPIFQYFNLRWTHWTWVNHHHPYSCLCRCDRRLNAVIVSVVFSTLIITPLRVSRATRAHKSVVVHSGFREIPAIARISTCNYASWYYTRARIHAQREGKTCVIVLCNWNSLADRTARESETDNGRKNRIRLYRARFRTELKAAILKRNS